MLFAVPRQRREATLWLLNTAFEALLAFVLWNIDDISEEVHLVTTSRWHIDPGVTSSSCAAPVEAGKLAGAAFVISIVGQILAILAVHAVERIRARHTPPPPPTWSGRIHSFPNTATDDSGVIFEGLPELLYVCHGILGFVVSGGIAVHVLNLLLRTPVRFRVCPHLKVVGVFKFACFATTGLAAWYFTIAATAVQLVLRGIVGDPSLHQEAKRR